MRDLIQEYASKVRDESGKEFIARAFGRERSDGTWAGWIEFEPSGGGEKLETGQETSQPNRTDLEYWATGLEPIFLEGALRRATDPARRRNQPEVGGDTARNR